MEANTPAELFWAIGHFTEGSVVVGTAERLVANISPTYPLVHGSDVDRALARYSMAHTLADRCRAGVEVVAAQRGMTPPVYVVPPLGAVGWSELGAPGFIVRHATAEDLVISVWCLGLYYAADRVLVTPDGSLRLESFDGEGEQ